MTFRRARDHAMRLLFLHTCGAVVRDVRTPWHCPACDPDCQAARAPQDFATLYVPGTEPTRPKNSPSTPEPKG